MKRGNLFTALQIKFVKCITTMKTWFSCCPLIPMKALKRLKGLLLKKGSDSSIGYQNGSKKSKKEAIREAKEMTLRFNRRWVVVHVDGSHYAVDKHYLSVHNIKPVWGMGVFRWQTGT